MRKHSDQTAATSSIALLQERFRELQRVKEKREERELMRRFTGSTSQVSPALMMAPRDHYPLSLGVELKRTEFHNRDELRSAIGLEPDQSRMWSRSGNDGSTASRSFENSDVDTSLHL